MLINISKSAFLTILLLTYAASEAHGFGKAPIAVPDQGSVNPAPSVPVVVAPAPVPSPTPSPAPAPEEVASVDIIRARWEAKNRDGAAWSRHVFETIPSLAPNLLAKAPQDVLSFCPAYNSLSTADKKNFWVYLMSSMTEFESAQNPSVIYTETFKDVRGNRVQSRGLLQISIESGNAYGCAFKNADEIHDPIKNLDCGLRILNRWVGKDLVISGKSGSTWIGGARYWSTLRLEVLTKIKGYTKALRMCAV